MTKYILFFLPLFLFSKHITIENNLIWQDNEDSAKKKLSFYEGEEYCKNLIIENYSNWRLPTKEELESIMDKTKFNPAIKDNFVNTGTKDWYWTSSEILNKAYIVLFYRGYTNIDDKSNKHFIRCVRGKN
jgi:hypothetical protein